MERISNPVVKIGEAASVRVDNRVKNQAVGQTWEVLRKACQPEGPIRYTVHNDAGFSGGVVLDQKGEVL